MESRRMDLFHLTNLEVFKNLRQGLFSESLPAQLEKSVQIAPCRREKIDPLVKIRLTPKKSWRQGSI